MSLTLIHISGPGTPPLREFEYGRLSSEISWMGINSRTLSSKRAQILATNIRGNTRIITAMVPLAELSRYATILRSLTQGRAYPYMEPSHYEEVPALSAEKIIQAAQKEKEES